MSKLPKSQNSESLHHILRSRFGFEEFRGVQKSLLEALLKGGSVLGIMPTGEGKSLCYQLPCFLDLPQSPGTVPVAEAVLNTGPRSELVLVMSPLIALMQDQVSKAKKLGLQAACLHSAMDRARREKIQNQLAQNHWQLLFVTPERFRKPEFLKALQNNKIKLFVVDEAHCISSWGHDFRPDYLKLGEARALLGDPLTLALTATATPIVQQDILKQLGLTGRASVQSSGFSRPELSLQVREVYGFDDKVRSLLGLLKGGEAGSQTHLVYVTLISTLLKLSQALDSLGVSHLVYHGELEPSRRRQVLKDFQEKESVVVLATPAFGLGIDRADVRSVIHAELPSSLEAYYQEVGRAGRDRRPAQGHLLWDPDDVPLQMQFIESSFEDVDDLEFAYRFMDSNLLRLQTEGIQALKEQLSFKNSRNHRTESILRILERVGSIRWIDARAPSPSTPLDPGKSSMNENLSTIESHSTNENPSTIESNRTSENPKIHSSSKLNAKLGFELIESPDPRALEEILNPELKRQAQKNLLSLVQYAGLQEGCRMRFVLTHFGEANPGKCGVCDLCLKEEL